MTRQSHEIDRYFTGEEDVVIGPLATWDGTGTPKGFIWAHGATETAQIASSNWRIPLDAMGRHGTVHVGDYGFHTWGKGSPGEEVTDRIDDGIDLLVADFGVVEPVALIGMSMGGCSVLNYALRNPLRVSCVALFIPMLSIADVRTNGLLAPYWSEIDAIYGAPPADYSANSPIEFVGSLDPDIPMHIWSSSNDQYVYRSTHEAFVAARPQTGFTDIGAIGHTIGVNQIPQLMSFLATHHL